MVVDATSLKALVGHEVDRISDTRLKAHIRSLLVEPHVLLRDWDYGKPGEQYPCWSILENPESGTGVVYCEYGFGPKLPWGLVWLSPPNPMSMGQDCSWYRSFLQAFEGD